MAKKDVAKKVGAAVLAKRLLGTTVKLVLYSGAAAAVAKVVKGAANDDGES